MLVYGCRCAPVDLGYLPSSADADFILDYALLMFNRFTRGTSVVHGTGPLTPEFWAAAAKIIQNPTQVHVVDRVEHPYLTDGEDAVVVALRKSYPSLKTDWFHVPRAVLH